MSRETPHVTASIEALTPAIREADAAVQKAERGLAVLEMRFGQEVACIDICGRHVALTALGPDYMLRPVPGTHALREAAIQNQREHLIALRSKAEGLRWKLKQIVKAI